MRNARSARARPGRVLVVVGAASVILGGLVAAGTGPLRLAHGSWLAAYLVLVSGVAQYAFGRVPGILRVPPRPARWGWVQVIAWNVGNAAVVAGTLTAAPALVDGGAACLAVGLLLAWLTVTPVRLRSTGLPARVTLGCYRGFLLILLISLPVGSVLAHLRHPG